MEINAPSLLRADAEAVPLSERPGHIDSDDSFANVEATETTCALFHTILADTKLSAIETSMTFWHINWRDVHPPHKTAQVCTNDNRRLWRQVKVEGETGSLTLFMREKNRPQSFQHKQQSRLRSSSGR